MKKQNVAIVYISTSGTLEHLFVNTTIKDLENYVSKKIELGVKPDQILIIPITPQKR